MDGVVFSHTADEEPTMPPTARPPMVVFTRPQDWAQPARDILWPRLAAARARENRDRDRGQ